MLCQICKQQEATIHLEQKVGTRTNAFELCEDCVRTEMPELAAIAESMGQRQRQPRSDEPKKD